MKNQVEVPVEITFELKTDEPETSGLLDSLRKMGFVQKSVGVKLPQLTYKGVFNGTQENLEALRQALKSHQTKT